MNYHNIWKSKFGHKTFANCEVCKNQIRISPEIGKIIKTKVFHNIKAPHVFWLNDYALCYICHNRGNTIEEVVESYNNSHPMENNYYLENWYLNHGYCIHRLNKFRLCGSKKICDNGLCEKHLQKDLVCSIAKKGKFTH